MYLTICIFSGFFYIPTSYILHPQSLSKILATSLQPEQGNPINKILTNTSGSFSDIILKLQFNYKITHSLISQIQKYRKINNKFLQIELMGGCAGCTGPNRRGEEMKVNRLSENSPMKSKLSASELSMHKKKDRIIQNLKQQKYRRQSNISSTSDLNNGYFLARNIMEPNNSKLPPSIYNQNDNVISSLLHKSILRQPQIIPSANPPMNRQSQIMRQTRNEERKQNINLRKTNSFSMEKENQEDHVYRSIIPKSVVLEEERKVMSSSVTKPAFPRDDPLNISNISEKIAMSELRLQKNQNLSESFTLNFKKQLSHIPQHSDEQAKTPLYVKEIRQQNGQDIIADDLHEQEFQNEAVPTISLFKYLKDLSN